MRKLTIEAPEAVKRLPIELSPINIHAYFSNCFDACGCSDVEEMVGTVRRLLEWHNSVGSRPHYSTLYSEVGVYYLLVGLIDRLGLADHGVSIRCPWLTEDGAWLLEALQRYPSEEIAAASGKAYDGCYYNNFTFE